MKKYQRLVFVGILLAFVSGAFAQADLPIHLFNRLRLSYDDNVYQVGNNSSSGLDKKDSFRIVEEIEILLNLNMERTYLGLRYRPSLIWYENRDNDDTDILHDVDFNFTHAFSPTLSLSVQEVLRASQLPELQDENFIVRENDDNYLNSLIATLSYTLLPETRIDLSGRYIVLAYDSDSPGKEENNNYYSLVGGLTLRQRLASRSSAMVDLRYQTVVYNKAEDGRQRDADTVYAGAGWEQTFSAYFVGSLRLGVESRMYDLDMYDDNTGPYAEASLTFLPTPSTRFTLSGAYSIYESDVDLYMSQDRTHVSISAAHDFTAKLSAYASAAYTLNSYDADYAMAEGLEDGDEKAYLFSARVSYRLNRINWLEAGWQFIKLDSELPNRESYERNRFDIGWKIQLF